MTEILLKENEKIEDLQCKGLRIIQNKNLKEITNYLEPYSFDAVVSNPPYKLCNNYFYI